MKLLPRVRFFRLPNLPTAPGDALAGAAVGIKSRIHFNRYYLARCWRRGLSSEPTPSTRTRRIRGIAWHDLLYQHYSINKPFNFPSISSRLEKAGRSRICLSDHGKILKADCGFGLDDSKSSDALLLRCSDAEVGQDRASGVD